MSVMLVHAMRVLFAALTLAYLVLNGWFLYYVDRLEHIGCKCAMGWRRQVIETSLALFLLLGVAGLFINWQSHFPFLALIMSAITIMYIVVTRDFIRHVRSSDCECAETTAFETLNIWNWIQIACVAFVLFMLITSVVFMVVSRRGVRTTGRR